ncbi:MAG: hypothetical protein ACFFC7_12540 [Candidatus Hermodarchaeota archaeon]
MKKSKFSISLVVFIVGLIFLSMFTTLSAGDYLDPGNSSGWVKGDILQSSIEEFGSKIRHSAMYLGSGKVINIDVDGGVYEMSLTAFLAEVGSQPSPNFRVLRVRCTSAKRNAAANFAVSQKGQGYDTWSIILRTKQKDTGGLYGSYWYCNELVWAAYRRTDEGQNAIQLDPGGDKGFVSAGDIYSSSNTDVIYQWY